MPIDFAALWPDMLLPFAWGGLVGLVFSLVGAAGGILASFGLISVLGLTDANQVKPMAQVLTLATPLVAVPSYFRQCRLVLGLALILASGGLLGALIGSRLSMHYLANLSDFKPVFAILVLFIAAQLAWTLRPQARTSDASARAATAFEGLVLQGEQLCMMGVKHRLWSWKRIEFDFGGERFHYRPAVTFTAGFMIAAIASALGVGGGFLLVPFMAMVLRLPMFVVAGTAALAVFISSSASIANYMIMGVQLDWGLLIPMLAGTAAGAWLGPRISRYFKESWLRILLAGILLGIGAKYLVG